MSHGPQRIARVRRTYNQWVADQTLEDYSLRYTAQAVRQYSASRVGNTAMGAVSFLACEAIGGSLTLSFGTVNALAAIAAVSLLILISSLPIGHYAAKFGVDMDLLTRGAGFGYLGSTITSLIYACFTFILFAVEGAIMSQALVMCFGMPLGVAHIISAAVAWLVAAYGFRVISKMQVWTQPVWLILQLAPFILMSRMSGDSFATWTAYSGAGVSPAGFDLVQFGTASSILMSFLPQIGEQVDYLRFLPERSKGRNGASWWIALLSSGPGWVVIGALKLTAGSFLAWLALSRGLTSGNATQPSALYYMAFLDMLHSPGIALALTGVFVITCQTKINVTNAYAGSLAWSNFFSRLTHSHPGRVVWLSFTVLIALALMELDVFRIIGSILVVYSNFAAAWIGALSADLLINKPMGLSPPTIEFRRAHLYDINPVGVGALFFSLLLSGMAVAGLFGHAASSLAPWIGFAAAFTAAPAIAVFTGGRYYLARQPPAPSASAATLQCIICENAFEPPDMAHCPVYEGPICSLCCTLEMRCRDGCKTGSRLSELVSAWFSPWIPALLLRFLNTRAGRFCTIFFVLTGFVGMALLAVDLQFAGLTPRVRLAIGQALGLVFVLLILILGLVAWGWVLAQESRRRAEAEVERQTASLMDEIAAHERTDAELQKAKEAAESANVAKTRFIAGMSHEIRTPLNSISGYAQLLDRETVRDPHEAVRVIRRSAEHIANLVDGLLDIAKIETGALQLSRDHVRLEPFLRQLVDMFTLQATNKNLAFDYVPSPHLPDYVWVDEKRLSQVLMNLLSNAVKYTECGYVRFEARYRDPIADFEILDSGIGIPPNEWTRVFEPFERGRSVEVTRIQGTGLGLTIARLLVHLLGGEITLNSTPGRGSAFRIRFLLPEAPAETRRTPERLVSGYRGPRRSILVTDDNPAHVAFLVEILTGLNFDVRTAGTGEDALAAILEHPPDLLIVDLTMPGLSGLDVARQLRKEGFDDLPILVVSADAHQLYNLRGGPVPYDDFLLKPFELGQLYERLSVLLDLELEFSGTVETPYFAGKEA